MNIVRCNSCRRWIGKDEDLGLYYEDDTEYCPNCKGIEALVDVDSNCKFSDQELVKLWDLFGEIPVDDNDVIQEKFLGFECETHREEVWHWFDERYSGGVVKLMFGGDS